MASDPSEGNIAQVIEFSGCDSDTAARYLKVKNNDVSAAIAAIFDQEDISQAEVRLPGMLCLRPSITILTAYDSDCSRMERNRIQR